MVHKKSSVIVTGIICGFAVVGSLLLTRSHAATAFIVAEPETGSVAYPASIVADTTASASKSVRFAPAVAPPPSSGLCTTIPSAPGVKPDATNTGVPTGTVLTPSSDITVTTPNTVIDAKDINGAIFVNANNVTIQNSKIHNTWSAYMAIKISDTAIGTKILHSTLYTTAGGYEGIIGGNFTACGNDISGFENGMTIGGDTIVQANYFHNLQSAQVGAHYDGIEIYSGSNQKILGNNILMTDKAGNWLDETGAINLTATWSTIANTVINGNWIGGGSYTLYIRTSTSFGTYVYSNIKVSNNVWYGIAPKGYANYGPMSDEGGLVTYTNNTWENGAAL